MSNGKVMHRPKFSVAIQTDTYQNLIKNTLGDPERAKRFVAAISSAVATNPQLQECDAGSILSAALLGESLNLSPSPQLGEYYLVPFKVKMTDSNGQPGTVQKAQFVLGYKGYMQLAIRSGQIKKLNVMPVKEGELIRYDPYEGIFEAKYIEDETERESRRTIGYYAMFELLNGYRRILYWSFGKMLHHADEYSKAFSAKSYEKILANEIPQKDMWKYSSFWYKDFDGMACKTMLRQLISKGGCPMSTEMQTAYESDMATIQHDDEGNVYSYNYVDNPTNTESLPEPTPEIPDDAEQSTVSDETDQDVIEEFDINDEI